MDEKELLANSITKAIAYAENGGKVDVKNPKKGKTGEMKSIYQFTPHTWHAYAKEVFGQDNVPMDADHETYVVREKVKKWIDEGKTASEIASIWNAGNPNAYKENHKGINKKYGVAYDTPAYAKKVLDYSKQFYTEKASNISQDGKALGVESHPIESNDALNNIMATIKSTKTAPSIEGNALRPSGLLPQLARRN